jgi:hypothetical protein
MKVRNDEFERACRMNDGGEEFTLDIGGKARSKVTTRKINS